MLSGARRLKRRPSPRTPLPGSTAKRLTDADHFCMIRTAQRRFAPTVFGINRNSDRHQIGIGDRLRRNTHCRFQTDCLAKEDAIQKPKPSPELHCCSPRYKIEALKTTARRSRTHQGATLNGRSLSTRLGFRFYALMANYGRLGEPTGRSEKAAVEKVFKRKSSAGATRRLASRSPNFCISRPTWS